MLKMKVLEDIFIPELKILAFDIETSEVGGKKHIVMALFYSDYYIYHQILLAALRVLQVLGVKEKDLAS